MRKPLRSSTSLSRPNFDAIRLAIEYVAPRRVWKRRRQTRKHGQAQIRKLAAGIDRHGFNVPLIVDDELALVSGHPVGQRQQMRAVDQHLLGRPKRRAAREAPEPVDLRLNGAKDSTSSAPATHRRARARTAEVQFLCRGPLRLTAAYRCDQLASGGNDLTGGEQLPSRIDVKEAEALTPVFDWAAIENVLPELTGAEARNRSGALVASSLSGISWSPMIQNTAIHPLH
ncbi:hypothetical protein [Sphingomonas sp.]|uniref:hypothetical protein n=1 Tax=Sphingomonas sp. TaxID=28214 RepID=UPI0025D8F116|nr:hypothetical protein [Sphingomonas sp.]